jgi:hypothetical protein
MKYLRRVAVFLSDRPCLRTYYRLRARFKPQAATDASQRIADLNVKELFVGELTQDEQCERTYLKARYHFWIVRNDLIAGFLRKRGW